MPTVVLHSKTVEKITGTCCMRWSVHHIYRLHNGELVMNSRSLQKEKALGIIKKLGLVEQLRTPDGELYDTPDCALKQIFPNGLWNKNDIRTIEKADLL